MEYKDIPYRSRCAGFVTLLAICCFAGTPAWANQFCHDASASLVGCTDPTAIKCYDLEEPFDSQYCYGLGYTFNGAIPPEFCLDATCTQTFAQVPELEDYAAALFLGLALMIGWKTRTRHLAAA